MKSPYKRSPNGQTISWRERRARAVADGVPCAKCGNAKRLLSSSYCSSCTTARTLEWRAKNPGQAKNYRLKKKFGITLGEYDSMLVAQGGVCAICHYAPHIGTRRLAVDHDHRTGKIRALLCTKCNRGLPWFRDNATYLESAARYIRKYGW